MDVFTILEIDGLQRTLEFLRDVFPWITLIALLITTLAVTLAEKRNRKLVLERSTEQERIEGLDQLNADERERLLKAAAPLPESREAYPLPDLPLRLVSALAKVFALLKIFLLLGSAYGMARIAKIPDSKMTAEHPAILAVLIALLVALAVFQIIASARVTRGGNGARRFLIFMAVLELGSIAVIGMSYELLWRGIIVAMSVYTVWVLLLRKGAQGAVSHDFKLTRIWQKVAVLVLCFISLFGEPFDFSFNTTASASAQKLESSSSSTDRSGISMPVRRVVLQAGDDSEDTWTLMESLRDTLDASADLVRFGRVPSRKTRGDDMHLLVSKTVDEKLRSKDEKGLDKELLGLLAKENSEMAGLFAPSAEYDHKVAFDLRTLLRNDFFARSHTDSNTRGMSSPSIRLTQGAEYAGKSRDAILGDLSDAIAKTLNQYIRQREDKVTLRALPEGLVAAPEPMPAPEFDFMKGAVREAEYSAVGQQFTLYRVGAFGAELLTTVSNQLVAAEWKHGWGGKFTKGYEKISVQGEARFHGQESLPHLHLIHARSLAEDFSEASRIELCQKNYADFLAIFHTKSVPADVLFDATREYLDSPDLSATELYRVYELTKYHKRIKLLHPGVLLRFARALRDEPMSEWTFEQYKHLGQAIAVDRAEHPAVCDQIAELFVDQMVHLDLRMDTNGMDRAEVTVDAGNRPLLVIMSKTRNEPSESREFLPFYHLSWMDTLEDGICKVYGATPRGSSTSEGAKPEGRYVIIFDFSANGSNSGSSECGGYNSMMRPRVDQNVRSGDLCVTCEQTPESNQVHVAVMFNDDRLVVSRAADGDYFLNKELMTEDELFTELMQRQVRDGALRVVALLEKSDREDFKTLLSNLPERSRGYSRSVKYADPPKTDADISDL